jgi:hypothetical protein
MEYRYARVINVLPIFIDVLAGYNRMQIIRLVEELKDEGGSGIGAWRPVTCHNPP